MDCPRCALINPDWALRCDCGYDFPSGTFRASYLDTTLVDVLEQSGALDHASAETMKLALERGARYVVFEYCISILVMSFKRTSRPYLVEPEESGLRLGFRYSLISVLCGWLSPVRTIETIVTNCRGGLDVTNDLLSAMVHDSR